MNWIAVTGILSAIALFNISYFAHGSPVCGAYSAPLSENGTGGSEDYLFGESKISISCFRSSGSPLLFFNMHDDENTAIAAARDILPELGGTLLHLEHSGERLIEFDLRGGRYRFDPNRIFTDAGARRTLLQYDSFTVESFQLIRAFARYLIDSYQLMERPLMVTLHNNTDGSYSVESYLPGGEYASDAEKVFLAPGSDADDFFFVTAPEHFLFFKNQGFNVVLQDNQQVTDDGSLSVLAGKSGIPYVNVEAEHGHKEEQKRMLRALYRIVTSIQSLDQ